jgi:probable HAF family extracellular repeat protein
VYSRGFLWTDEEGITDIGSLVQGGRTEARDINNSGQVTGYSYISEYIPHAFLYTPGVGMQDLGYFAPTKKNQTWRSLGLDINDNGHVAGWAGAHAFLYTDHMIDLGSLGGDDPSKAYGLNGWDEVVGVSGPSLSPDTGFLYTNKTDTGEFVMVKLEDLIVDLPPDYQAPISARKINDAGQICGFCGHAPGQQAILLTPVRPLP